MVTIFIFFELFWWFSENKIDEFNPERSFDYGRNVDILYSLIDIKLIYLHF